MILRLLGGVLITPLRLLVAVLRFLVRLPFPRRVPPWVELELEGTLKWRKARRRRFSFGRRHGPSIEGVARLFDEVIREPAVRGVVLKLDELTGSPARLDALRAEIVRLRCAGKEAVAYTRGAGNGEYVLLSAASRIVLAPGAPLQLLGFAATTTSLKDALLKVGIAPEFFRKGQHKTAPERFTERESSPEARLVIDSVLDHHHARLVAAVAARKGGDEAAARELIDRGPYTARGARQAGLVDDLAYPDQLARLVVGGPEKEPRLGSPASLRRSRRWRMRWPRLRARPLVALVPIEGLIKGGKSVRWPGGNTLAGSDSVTESLDEVRRDRRVKAVVVSIDSRGGAAPASELMWRAVLRCAEEKPTVAYVDEVAASGGYFAAAGARRIVAAPSALVGSIGVFAGRFDARELLGRLGIRQEVFLRGAHAGILAPAHALSEEERAHLLREIEETYEEFVERVAEGRRRRPEDIREVAEGRVFVAAQAPAVLVDEVGGLPAALAWAAKEIGAAPGELELRISEHAGMRPDLRALLSFAAELSTPSPLLLWPEKIDLR